MGDFCPIPIYSMPHHRPLESAALEHFLLLGENVDSGSDGADVDGLPWRRPLPVAVVVGVVAFGISAK